jgi:template-activating factor I
MLEFDWEQHVAPQATKIQWKDDSKNLTKLYARVMGEEADDMPSDPGSFFNFFEHADDPFDVSCVSVSSYRKLGSNTSGKIGMAIATDLFPEAIDYFTGNAGETLEFDDESEDDDEEDEEEIDLEKPRKKQKTA